MKAIVLAGGFGTRIQPLTNSIPKPMLPILNRPMMEHTIVKLRDELDIKDIVVLLYFKPEIIKSYFGNGKELGVNITYVLPDDDYGTAGAVAFAREYLDETFIIVSGDLVTDFDFKKISKFHQDKKSKLTITLTPVEDPLQFGVVIANKNDQIEKFLEKPSWGEVFSDTINTGIYLIEPEILEHIPYGENFDFAKDLFPLLMSLEIPLWGCPIKGYWRDVGNPTSYRDVYRDIFDGKIDLSFKGERKEIDEGVVYLEEGAEIHPKVRVRGLAVLAKGVKISEGVTLDNVSIGKNTIIKKHAELINCTIWNDVSIGVKAKLINSVICNNNIIKDEVKASFGVVIAENCEIKRKVSFERDIVMWPDKIIDENSVVSSNVIWGTKYKSSIFENGMVTGRTNIELSPSMAIKIAESFGSIFPVGSYVYISRDYHTSSRMIKRAFLSGTLSSGLNILDLENVPSNVMRYTLANNDKVVAGVHIRRSSIDPMDTQIVLYTSEGLRIDSKISKSIERVFFKEDFRRVKYTDIGNIYVEGNIVDAYVEALKDKLDVNLFKNSEFKIATDIMFGSTSQIYPKVCNDLNIDAVLLNAYNDDKKFTKVKNFVESSQKNIQNIVKSLSLDYGFIIYPSGQKLQLVDDKGHLVFDYILLLVILELLDRTAQGEIKVLLPAWAPGCIKYKNIKIKREKLSNLKAEKFMKYDLIASSDGHFAFTEFGITKDAIFSGFKILELLKKADTKVSDIVKELPKFIYKGENIACPSSKKGKMMRKFLEEAKDKKVSTIDGVQIYFNSSEWILMVPDEYNEYLNIYIQADTKSSANKILAEYKNKIEIWKSE
jgi:mannose-1-phosphate guanylyltransferase/phosphomannomutase